MNSGCTLKVYLAGLHCKLNRSTGGFNRGARERMIDRPAKVGRVAGTLPKAFSNTSVSTF